MIPSSAWRSAISAGTLLRFLIFAGRSIYRPPDQWDSRWLTCNDVHPQERSLRGGITQNAVLKALPIFEAANAAGAAEPIFTDLHQCTMAAPEGMPTAGDELIEQVL